MGETVREEVAARIGWRIRLLPLLAGSAMLLASFVSFLRYHDYPLWRSEVAIAVAILLAVSVSPGSKSGNAGWS